MAKLDEKKELPKDEYAELRKKRRADAEALIAEKAAEVDQREEFRKFFARINGQLKLDRSMEHILWLHLQAAGFAKVDKFSDGVKHFGYKL